MAWCPICGRYWIVRSGQAIKRGILGRSNNDVLDPPDMICPDCEKPDAAT